MTPGKKGPEGFPPKNNGTAPRPHARKHLRRGWPARWIVAAAFILAMAYAPKTRAQTPPTATAATSQAPAPAASEVPQKITGYTLPPERYKKAVELGRTEFRLQLIDIAYGFLTLWLILQWKIAPKYRDWAEAVSPKRFIQALVFAPPMVLTLDAIDLPTEIYGHWISRTYGLSVQGWGSWAWDWTKSEIVSILFGTILVMILYAVIRRSARRWWFYFWLVSLPIIVFVIFVQPLVIDPLYNKFEPLQKKDPALTLALERMVQRTGKNIPPDRMFWMKASAKSTELNAYVTGIGASKRIVIWDTTIAKMTRPEIVFVVGHEMGHYVLNHIPKGIAFYAALFLVASYLGYRCILWMLRRWGGRWAIRGVNDWASLPALLFLLALFSFAADPITSAFSRHIEHQADEFGLEVTHGLTPDSGQVAAHAFNVLGNVDLTDPKPNPVNVFLFYSHPPIPQRIRFALTYDPWAHGGHGKFIH